MTDPTPENTNDEATDAASDEVINAANASSDSDATSEEISGDTIAFELELASLREKLEAASSERDANADKAIRAQAELENVRRRHSKELADKVAYQSLPFVRDLVPGLDNLHRAIQAAENSGSIDELMQGLKMVVAQFDEILSRNGTTPIESVGQPFDPNLHQALQQIPSADHPPMTVLQEVERGYKLKDRIVRPSKVIVSCAVPEAAPTEDASE